MLCKLAIKWEIIALATSLVLLRPIAFGQQSCTSKTLVLPTTPPEVPFPYTSTITTICDNGTTTKTTTSKPNEVPLPPGDLEATVFQRSSLMNIPRTFTICNGQSYFQGSGTISNKSPNGDNAIVTVSVSGLTLTEHLQDAGPVPSDGSVGCRYPGTFSATTDSTFGLETGMQSFSSQVVCDSTYHGTCQDGSTATINEQDVWETADSPVQRQLGSICGDIRDQLLVEYPDYKVYDINKSSSYFIVPVGYGTGVAYPSKSPYYACNLFTNSAKSFFYPFTPPKTSGNCGGLVFPDSCGGLNTGNYPWSLIRKPLVIAASSGYGLDRWRTLYGGARHINSAYRNPVRNAKVKGLPGSRHMFGDAVDFNNNSYSTSCGTGTKCLLEYTAMKTAAQNAHADYTELPNLACGYQCVHADWRNHNQPGGYQP